MKCETETLFVIGQIRRRLVSITAVKWGQVDVEYLNRNVFH